MISSASEFFETVVEPTVAEFLSSPLDIRKGRLAAIVLYHQADHWALETCSSKDRGEMQRLITAMHLKIINSCQDFVLVRDVADASKHAQLAASRSIPRTLSSSNQVEVTPGFFQEPLGYFAEACELYVTLDDGSTRALLPSIQSVLHYWKSTLC